MNGPFFEVQWSFPMRHITWCSTEASSGGLKYVSKICALNFVFDYVSGFSHSDSVWKLWKNQIFLPRDLQLSNFGKWNSFIIADCEYKKIFRLALLDIKLWVKDDILYQFWAFDWMNLNEYKGWSVSKSPSFSSESFISNTAELVMFIYC